MAMLSKTITASLTSMHRKNEMATMPWEATRWLYQMEGHRQSSTLQLRMDMLLRCPMRELPNTQSPALAMPQPLSITLPLPLLTHQHQNLHLHLRL